MGCGQDLDDTTVVKILECHLLKDSLLLDVSSVFSVVGYNILLRQTGKLMGLPGTVLNSFESHLKNMEYFVSVAN